MKRKATSTSNEMKLKPEKKEPTMNDIALRESPGLPTDYDPEKGMKNLAVAEAAEHYFLRAKDATKLYEAIEAKLGEQRRFVLWWDGQEKNPGNRGAGRGNVRPSQTTDALKAENYGLDRDTIHRWRKRLKDSRKFDEALEAAHARCVKVFTGKQGGAFHASTIHKIVGNDLHHGDHGNIRRHDAT